MDIRKKLVELIFDSLCHHIDKSCKLAENIADDLISNGVTVQEWFSVDYRLPEEKGEYLVAYHPCYRNDVKEDITYTGIDTFRGKTTWAKNKFQRITHWMPLPEPPKGE